MTTMCSHPFVRAPALAAALAISLAACGSEIRIGLDGGDAIDAAVDAVVPPDAAPTRLTVRTYEQVLFPGATPADVPWVIVRDGGGAWTTPAADGTGVYTTEVESPQRRYTVAVVCPATGVVRVLQATLAEGDDVAIVCARATPAPSRRLLVDISSPGPCTARVAYLPSSWTVRCGGSASGDVHAGPLDLLATGGPLGRVYVARDVDAAQWTIDLDDPVRSRPSRPARVTVDADAPLGVFFITQRGLLPVANTLGSFTFSGFPSELRDPLDLHLVQTGRHPALTWRLLREPADVDLDDLPALPLPVVTVTGAAADWEPYDASGFLLSLGRWQLAVSTGWLQGASRHDLPRLCEVAGFPHPCADAEPATDWTFTAVRPLTAAAPLPAVNAALISPPLAPDGLTFRTALTAGTFAAP